METIATLLLGGEFRDSSLNNWCGVRAHRAGGSVQLETTGEDGAETVGTLSPAGAALNTGWSVSDEASSEEPEGCAIWVRVAHFLQLVNPARQGLISRIIREDGVAPPQATDRRQYVRGQTQADGSPAFVGPLPLPSRFNAHARVG